MQQDPDSSNTPLVSRPARDGLAGNCCETRRQAVEGLLAGRRARKVLAGAGSGLSSCHVCAAARQTCWPRLDQRATESETAPASGDESQGRQHSTAGPPFAQRSQPGLPHWHGVVAERVQRLKTRLFLAAGQGAADAHGDPTVRSLALGWLPGRRHAARRLRACGGSTACLVVQNALSLGLAPRRCNCATLRLCWPSVSDANQHVDTQRRARSQPTPCSSCIGLPGTVAGRPFQKRASAVCARPAACCVLVRIQPLVLANMGTKATSRQAGRQAVGGQSTAAECTRSSQALGPMRTLFRESDVEALAMPGQVGATPLHSNSLDACASRPWFLAH